MSFPKFIPVTAAEAVERAKKIAAGLSKYILGAGGRNPQAEKPFTSKNGAEGSDCIGFVLWCLGLDRLQPDYPFYEGWINTDSMLMDVDGDQKYFEGIDFPYPGCAVVYPSIWKDGKMVRMGHIGLVVAVPSTWPTHEEWKTLTQKQRSAWMKQVMIIDCAAAATRRLTGRAVGKRTAEIWAKDGRFVAYKRQAPEAKETPVEVMMASPKLGSRWLKATNPMMRGQDVVELQKRIGMVPDGIFGPRTVIAVSDWQLKNGLRPDGVVGPATLAKLGIV